MHCDKMDQLTLAIFGICTVVAHVSAFPQVLRGVDPKLQSLYSLESTSFKCLDSQLVIDRTRVNDDYCDCIDGSDEPGLLPSRFYGLYSLVSSLQYLSALWCYKLFLLIASIHECFRDKAELNQAFCLPLVSIECVGRTAICLDPNTCIMCWLQLCLCVGTSACPNGHFYCKNIGHTPSILNSSFVDDGYCGELFVYTNKRLPQTIG